MWLTRTPNFRDERCRLRAASQLRRPRVGPTRWATADLEVKTTRQSPPKHWCRARSSLERKTEAERQPVRAHASGLSHLRRRTGRPPSRPRVGEPARIGAASRQQRASATRLFLSQSTLQQPLRRQGLREHWLPSPLWHLAREGIDRTGRSQEADPGRPRRSRRDHHLSSASSLQEQQAMHH